MRVAIPPVSQHIFMELCLVKHSDNFAFAFYILQLYHNWDETVLLIQTIN